MNQQPGTGRSVTEHDSHAGFRLSYLAKAGDGVSSIVLFALMAMTLSLIHI